MVAKLYVLFTGSAVDVITDPIGGVCMMGGASEHDEAMKWFLNRANGGDVLVLRATGSNGYNNYMYSSLGVSLNSVETIVFNNSAAANEAYIQDRISKAEAVWFAGGDQWDYISYWRNTAIDSLINDGIENRNIVVGGTSVGMAILGGYYFSAEHGTVTSAEALTDPYDFYLTVDSASFLKNNFLENVITDSHYDDPDRKGRHVTFLARIFMDYGVEAKGVACNEYTAVCIDTNGIARVYGDYPAYDEGAYFLQLNCALSDIDKIPEICVPNTPLTWNLNQQIIKVYKVHGTNNGVNTFNLKTWQTGSGGEWQNWYVENGVLFQEDSYEENCSAVIIEKTESNKFSIYPNPTQSTINLFANGNKIKGVVIYDVNGKTVYKLSDIDQLEAEIDLTFLDRGVYIVEVEFVNEMIYQKVLKT